MLNTTHKGMISHFAGSSKHKRKYSDEQVKGMRDRILVGETYESIAKDYGVTRASIHKAIQRHNPIVKNERVPKGYIHISEYCQEHNVKYNTVIYHIKKKSLPAVKSKNKIYLHIDTELTNNKFISEDKIDMICKLSTEGLNNTKVAEKLKINRATVKYYTSSTWGRSWKV